MEQISKDSVKSMYYEPNSPSTKVRKALVACITENNTEKFKKMYRVFELPTTIDCSSDSSGTTIIHYACKGNSPEILEFLLELSLAEGPEAYTSNVNIQNK